MKDVLVLDLLCRSDQIRWRWKPVWCRLLVDLGKFSLQIVNGWILQ